MNTTEYLRHRIDKTQSFLSDDGANSKDNMIILANQIAIMEYLQHLDKVVEQNTLQLEYLVEKVTNIEEGMEELLDCDVVVVEQEMKENERIVRGD